MKHNKDISESGFKQSLKGKEGGQVRGANRPIQNSMKTLWEEQRETKHHTHPLGHSRNWKTHRKGAQSAEREEWSKIKVKSDYSCGGIFFKMWLQIHSRFPFIWNPILYSQYLTGLLQLLQLESLRWSYVSSLLTEFFPLKETSILMVLNIWLPNLSLLL